MPPQTQYDATNSLFNKASQDINYLEQPFGFAKLNTTTLYICSFPHLQVQIYFLPPQHKFSSSPVELCKKIGVTKHFKNLTYVHEISAAVVVCELPGGGRNFSHFTALTSW